MINLWTSRDRLLASYRKNGELEVRDLGAAEYTAFVRDSAALQGVPGIIDRQPDFPGWTKIWFRDWDSRKSALDQYFGLMFEGDVSAPRRFLTDNFCKIDPPRRVYLDLETDHRVPFSQAIQGHTTLLSWAVVDEEGNKQTAVLQDWGEEPEVELWAELWNKLALYDQVSAWNGDRFDFSVMNERSFLLAKSWRKHFEPFWEHRRRLLFVDQMLCFKRHHMAAESGDEKTSLKLGDVCEALIGEGKHDFDSSKTYDAWAAGGAERQRLVDYNLQDAALLPKLEAETGYLALQQTIAEVTLCPVNTHTLKPMPWIDAYLLKMAQKRKTHLPSKKPGGGDVEEVEGAIVLAPTKLGIHENVHVCDFKSLYPTIIRTFNLGSETKLTDEEAAVTEAKCQSPTGVYFRTDEQSMLSAFCVEMMNGRDKYKKEMKKYPPGTPEWKDVERKSKAFKIANNSGFGVTGNPYFRLFDPDVTRAIIQGARASLLTAKEAAERENKEMIYGDTDSLFIVGGSVEEFEQFVERCNKIEFPKMLDGYRCREDFRVIELAYEKQFARLIFPLGVDGEPSAKRYCGLYSHYGGKAATADSKPEIRGLEFMRTDVVRLARHMQREAIEMMLRGKCTAEQMHEWVKRKRELFIEGEVPVEDIVLSKGISRTLDLYKTCGPHVRIARMLEAKGEDIGEGTRISYIVTNGSVSPAQVIPAEEYRGQFDRRYYWNRSIYPATMRILSGAFPSGAWRRWILKANVPLTQRTFSFF